MMQLEKCKWLNAYVLVFAFLGAFISNTHGNNAPVFNLYTTVFFKNENNADCFCELNATDIDGDSYSFSTTTEGFSINNDSICPIAAFDFESLANPMIEIQVTVEDVNGAKNSQTINLNIEDVNEPPTNVRISSNSLKENTLGCFAEVQYNDPDKYNSVEIRSLNNNYYISRDSICVAYERDFENIQIDSLNISLSDNENYVTELFLIDIIDENETPKILDLYIPELEYGYTGCFYSIQYEDPDNNISDITVKPSTIVLKGDSLCTADDLVFVNSNSIDLEIAIIDSEGLTDTAFGNVRVNSSGNDEEYRLYLWSVGVETRKRISTGDLYAVDLLDFASVIRGKSALTQMENDSLSCAFMSLEKMSCRIEGTKMYIDGELGFQGVDSIIISYHPISSLPNYTAQEKVEVVFYRQFEYSSKVFFEGENDKIITIDSTMMIEMAIEGALSRDTLIRSPLTFFEGDLVWGYFPLINHENKILMYPRVTSQSEIRWVGERDTSVLITGPEIDNFGLTAVSKNLDKIKINENNSIPLEFSSLAEPLYSSDFADVVNGGGSVLEFSFNNRHQVVFVGQQNVIQVDARIDKGDTLDILLYLSDGAAFAEIVGTGKRQLYEVPWEQMKVPELKGEPTTTEVLPKSAELERIYLGIFERIGKSRVDLFCLAANEGCPRTIENMPLVEGQTTPIVKLISPDSIVLEPYVNLLYPLDANVPGVEYTLLESPEWMSISNGILFGEIPKSGAGDLVLEMQVGSIVDTVKIAYVVGEEVELPNQKDDADAEGSGGVARIIGVDGRVFWSGNDLGLANQKMNSFRQKGQFFYILKKGSTSGVRSYSKLKY